MMYVKLMLWYVCGILYLASRPLLSSQVCVFTRYAMLLILILMLDARDDNNKVKVLVLSLRLRLTVSELSLVFNIL
jgi:hypothetical protein